MMSNHIQIVRTQMTQRWQYTHCSQKPVADSQNNQMAPVLDKKNPGVYQVRILQWNDNGIHREIPPLEDLLEATNVDMVYIQETKLQPKDKNPEIINPSAVRCDRPVQEEARVRGLMIHTLRQIPDKISHPQATNSSAM